MAIFNIPDFTTVLIPEILAKIKDKRPGAATGPGSDADVQSWTLAHVVHGLHIHLKYGLLHQIIPTKASGWPLSAWAWLFGLDNGSGGYGRILARASYVDAGFTFVADTGPGWPDLYQEVFVDSSGRRYQINEHYTPTAAGTTPALDVLCLETGKAGNVEVLQGETWTWESTPTQMTATITQTVDLDYGADEETDVELRARMTEYLQAPAMGGNWAHFRKVAQEASPGNVDAFIYEGIHDESYGYSCTDVACCQRDEYDTDREIQDGDDLHQTIEDELEDAIAWGQMFRGRVLDTNGVKQEVELAIKINDTARDSDRCDFDAYALDQASGLTVSAYNETNKTITCSQNIHNDIEVDDHVIIYSAQAIVTKVGTADGLAANTMFEVSAWFETYDEEINPYNWADGYDPTGDHVLSGGGHILACITKLRDLFASLGPGKGNNAAPQPGWEDTLRKQKIQSSMIEVGDAAGEAVIYDTTITTPATDTAPTAGSGVNAYFLYPGELIIWEDKT